jgi:hypothetical protein
VEQTVTQAQYSALAYDFLLRWCRFISPSGAHDETKADLEKW